MPWTSWVIWIWNNTTWATKFWSTHPPTYFYLGNYSDASF